MVADSAPPNTLYYGDNLQILRERIPSESVDLCYIDPPFNSQRNYNQIYATPKRVDAAQEQAFTDTWTWDTQAALGFHGIITNEGGRFQAETIELFRGLRAVLKESSLLAYLVSIAVRLVEIHRVLKPTGSFYLHCDPTASHYLKIVLDSIFEAANYRNEIVWKRKAGRGETNNAAIRFGVSTDTILFYAKGQIAPFNRQYRESNANYIATKFTHKDASGRRYRLDNITSPSPRPNLTYEYKGHVPPPNGWAVSRERMEEMDRDDRLYLPTDKSKRIQRKRYLDELEGETVDSLWDDISPINSQAQERLGYPTQKPEALLRRIITASSSEGDLVLDAYCGCGTTVAVAEKLGRHWIGIDITYQSISLILKRIEDTFGPGALRRVRVDGIPRDVESAEALALRKDDRTRKEFEKWAVLTYSNNRAVINQKKGADQGIDGTAYFMVGPNETEKMVFQVKSGNVQRGDIAKLNSDMQRENASMAVLLTLQEPTQPMRDEASKTGMYHHALMGRSMNRIQIVTVREIIEEGKRLDLPMTADVLKAAPRVTPKSDQDALPF